MAIALSAYEDGVSFKVMTNLLRAIQDIIENKHKVEDFMHGHELVQSIDFYSDTTQYTLYRRGFLLRGRVLVCSANSIEELAVLAAAVIALKE